MSAWVPLATDVLWRNAMAAIPLALLVAVLCRCICARPTTRHTLWLIALLWFVSPVGLPGMQLSGEVPIVEPAEVGLAVPDIEDQLAASSAKKLLEPRTMTQFRAADRLSDVSLKSERRSGWKPDVEFEPRETGTRAEWRVPERLAQTTPSARELIFRDEPVLVGDDSTSSADGRPLPDSCLPALASGVTDDPTAVPVTSASTGGDFKNALAATVARFVARWRAVFSRVLTLRDHVGSEPLIPVGVWVGGVGFLLLVRVGQSVRFRRRLRSAFAAPRSVTDIVSAASEALQMRRVPEALMVGDNVSPMICCGRRARLILPVRLWSQLDDAGRRAVIYHELAHLRRRDHWVCWGELVIGILYWWHPVVWFVRSRLRAEAELCCDAWVTWLLPGGRRAYAEALLKARQYISESHPAVSAVGIGVTTGRARRFARRIKMVMTESVRPGLSVPGVVLCLALAAVGWLATPAQSGEQELIYATAPVPLVVGQSDDGDLEERVERLEKLVQKLIHEVKKREGHREPPKPPPAPEPRLREFMKQLKSPKGELLIRSYALPEGKLEVLTKLMIREDVPILVAPQDDCIEVHATEENHARFKAFADLINPEKEVQTYRLSEGKLKALTTLMARDDIPVLIEIGDDSIKVHGASYEQDIFESFVRMIDPSAGCKKAKSGFEKKGEAKRKDKEEKKKKKEKKWKGDHEAKAFIKNAPDIKKDAHVKAALHRKMADAQGKIMQIASHLQECEMKARDLEQQASMLEVDADRFEEQARDLEMKARQLKRDTRNLKDADRQAALAMVQTLETEAMVAEGRAQALEAQAEALEQLAEELEAQAEELEAQIEEFEQEIEAPEDDAEDLEEEWEVDDE